MKKLLFFIPIFLLAFTSNYTPDLNKAFKPLACDQVLYKKAFDICYNYRYKEPNAVAYILTKQMETDKHLKRKKLSFKSDYSIPRKYRSYSSNYTHGCYDRGHHAPNGAFDYNLTIQKQTFLMSNVSPQARWLNRIYWAKVERLARYLAIKYGKVEVITGNCGSKWHLKHGVNIPAYWYKIIYVPETNATLAFLAPNTNQGMKAAKIKKYQTNLSVVEKTCGF